MRLVATPGQSANPGLWRGLAACWCPSVSGRLAGYPWTASGGPGTHDLSGRRQQLSASHAGGYDIEVPMRHNYYDIASNPQMIGNRGPASAWKFSGTEYLIEDANQRELWLVNKPSTVIAWGAFVDYTYQNYPKFCTLKSDSGDNESWQLGISAQVGYEGIIFGSSSTWARCKTGTTFVQTTYTNHVVVVVYNGGTASSSSSFRVWHNGREATVASASVFGATSDYTRIGSDGTNFWYGQIGLVAVVHRAYSAYEARQVCHDPLAMFRPRKSLYKGYAPAGKGTRWQVSSASTGRRYWELKP